VPAPDKFPKFSQIYTYGIINDLDHQMGVLYLLVRGKGCIVAHCGIVHSYIDMLNSCNGFVQHLKMIQIPRG
jgi:hypothetical protein